LKLPTATAKELASNMLRRHLRENVMKKAVMSLLTSLALSGLMAGGPAIAADYDLSAEKPYRVLVVIGDQWDDPDSYCIGGPCVPGKDFRDVATMLKIWGIPFDILRLDQQRLQINRFLNGIAEPNYGCVIWMADPDKLEGFSANYRTMRSVVEDYGMSLIALFDYIKTPEIADLVGVDYQGTATMDVKDEKGGFAISEEHFVTAGADGTVLPRTGQSTRVTVVKCKAKPAAKVLGRLGEYPQLVVRDVSRQTKTVWIGGGRDWLNKYAVMREVFRRSLVHCMGYGIFNDNFENTLVFVMDDMGASDHAYGLPEWHYPTPGKEAIIKYLVEPLEEYGFVMVQNVTPGYVNPVTRKVENPWTVEKFVDPYGNVQDYGSTKAGLDEGVRRGVFEIHTHRVWTHMNWDLDSPPGSWWDAPLDGERARGAWYNEAYDFVRDVPVPSNDMLFLYKTGYDAIKRQFGIAPLAVSLQPIGTDDRLRHGNGRPAAIAGYGISWTTKYIGYDRLVHFSIPEMIPERLQCHDLDIIEKSDSEITGRLSELRKLPAATLIAAKVTGSRAVDLTGSRDWIESRRDKRWIGFNEICAYLHSDIDVSAADRLVIRIRYDDHYCRHFAKRPSHWTLELADRYRERLGRQIGIEIDGKVKNRAPAARQTLTLPAGVGVHTLQIRSQ